MAVKASREILISDATQTTQTLLRAGILLLAGRRAVRLSDLETAVALLRQGLALLDTQPSTAKRDRQRIDLLLGLLMPLNMLHGWGAPERINALESALSLAQKYNETDRIFGVLGHQIITRMEIGEHDQALGLAQLLLRSAEQAENEFFTVMSHFQLGKCYLFLGELGLASEHLEWGQTVFTEHHPRARRPNLFPAQNFEVSIAAWHSLVLFVAGYPDQACAKSNQALTRAEELTEQPVVQATTLALTGAAFHTLYGDATVVRTYAERLSELSTEKGMKVYEAVAQVYLGWTEVVSGEIAQGLEQMRAGLAAQRAAGAFGTLPAQLTHFATALIGANRAEEGLRVITEALHLAEQTNARFYVAEMWRVRGELLLNDQARSVEAERYFAKAVEVARRHGAKMWELRAAMSLMRLARGGADVKQKCDAHAMLADVYSWFSEGFDAPDLQAAKSLLESVETA